MSAIREAARAVRRAAVREVADDVRAPEYALVRRASPLTVELAESGIVLEESDLVLGQWVRRYIAENAFGVGDSLVVAEMDNGEYAVLDALAGMAPATGTGTEVYEQPNTPASTTVGAFWIDTDDEPPVWTSYVPLVTSLPASPADGAEVYYLADAANGIVWHLRYRAASASAYKWEFVGGSAALTRNVTPGTFNSGSFTGLTGASAPDYVVPLAGDYRLEYSAYLAQTSAIANILSVAPSIGGAAPPTGSEATIGFPASGGATVGSTPSGTYRATGLAAGTHVVLQFKRVNSADCTSNVQDLRVWPVRVA